MTAASNALEELQHARYLIDKGLRVALRRIDPTTKAFVSEMYYSSAQEAEEDAKHGTVACLYEIRMICGGKIVRRVRGSRVVAAVK
jgi:hypothetical protein